MSLTPEQRAPILHLHPLEAVSIVVLAVMTGLRRFAVRRVLHPSCRRDAPGVEKAAAMRPWSKGRVERHLHRVQRHLRRKATS